MHGTIPEYPMTLTVGVTYPYETKHIWFHLDECVDYANILAQAVQIRPDPVETF